MKGDEADRQYWSGKVRGGVVMHRDREQGCDVSNTSPFDPGRTSSMYPFTQAYRTQTHTNHEKETVVKSPSLNFMCQHSFFLPVSICPL